MSISYRASLVLYIGALVVFTGSTLTLYSLHNSSHAAESMATTLFQQVNSAAAAKTSTYVLRAVPLAQSLGALAGNGLRTDDSDALAHQLVAVIKVHPNVSWISFSDEHGTFTGAHWAPKHRLLINQSWVGANGGFMVEHDVKSDGSWVFARKADHWNYDPRTRPFYTAAARSGNTAWVGPYLFYDEGVPGVTCAEPVYGPDAKLQGVITVDFDLRNLSNFAHQAEQGLSAKCKLIILTPEGLVLGDPDVKIAEHHGTEADGTMLRVDGGADPLAAAMYAAIPPAVRGEEGSSTSRPTTEPGTLQHFHTLALQYEGQPYFAGVTTFQVDEGLTWMVVVAAPQSEFLADARRAAVVAAGVSSGAVLAAMLIAVILAQRVSGPILGLVAFMRRVGAGELEAKAQLGGSTEFRELSAALNEMIVGLRDRLRLRSSMAVAQQIQRKLLPANPPKVPGLDIAGQSTYCDETGGDYFDFLLFEPGGSRMFVTLGDVMGHGVGSALPMAGARAVLRTRATVGPSLGGLLGELNRLLASDLSGKSFMTMMVATIDAHTGVVEWSSAGHDPIIVYDAQDKCFFELEGADLPLGIDESTQYGDYSEQRLRKGQILVLASDGVWETANENRDMYGKDRLREVIRAGAERSAAEIGAAIKHDVETFRGTAPQTDDVTFVVIKVLQCPMASSGGVEKC